jgi:hypothetical protein
MLMLTERLRRSPQVRQRVALVLFLTIAFPLSLVICVAALFKLL